MEMPRKVTTKNSKNQRKIINVSALYNRYFTSDGFKRVRTYLGLIEKGQPKVWTAPFAKGESMETILYEWFKILVSIRSQWPTLYEFEEDLANKVGPMSVQLPMRERLDDIRHYYDDILLSSKAIDQRAIDAAIDEFSRLRGLRLRSPEKTMDNMKKSTSSGAPYQTKRRNVIQETLRSKAWIGRARLPFVQVDMPNDQRITMTTAILGWRGQEGGPSGEDVKQRVVWMFPFTVNLEELRVYQPLIEGAQSLNLVPAWVSMDSVDMEITRLFDTKSEDDLIVCTDFSKFDQHFNKDMQEGALLILSAILTKCDESDRWLREVFPIKYGIPLLVSYRGNYLSLCEGEHGMASGSGGTNADETLAHRALQHEAAILHGQELNLHSMCLGDDGILTYPGITVDDVVAVYESHGQECNHSKQYASTQDCVYLRRWHHKDYRINGVCAGVYSTARALGRLRYLERFMDPEYWSPQMVALRQLSIIENCKWHPLFHEFIEFCMKRDKYRLGIDIPGFLDNITQLAQESIDHMPDFLGYTKTLQGEGPSGIANWEVVKYLKSKR
nr:MAG: putative RNA-dependent RNA polymerase [Picobirnavirus sp.]